MITILVCATLAPSSFFLQPHDTVVFYGDSITERQIYTSYVEAFVRTRYPDLNVEFFCRGWAGDSSWGGAGGSSDQRMHRDVKPLDPTVVTVMFGMNDGGYVKYDPKIYKAFHDSYGSLLGYLHRDAPNARLTLIQTCPWDGITRDLPDSYVPDKWTPWKGYNDVLLRFGPVVKQNALKAHALYVDFNKPIVDVLESANKQDRKLAQKIITDGIHPGAAGSLVMAGELLKAWHASPVVSEVRLDARRKRVVGSANTNVTGFDGKSWDQHDRSLPFSPPVEDPAVQLVLQHYGFTDDLNKETLRIGGLKGRYELQIDGQKVAEFDSAQLGRGINLALYDTPMQAQARKVRELARHRCDSALFEWRSKVAKQENRKLEGWVMVTTRPADELEKAEKETAQPKTHHYVLLKIGQP